MPALTMDQLREFIKLFESLYPKYYGYTAFEEATADNRQRYYLFRNREESFMRSKAIAILVYRD